MSADGLTLGSSGTFPAPGPTTVNTPIALALDIDNGVGTPLSVRKGQLFYLNQIDIRASLNASVDEGVAGLDQSGDFSTLDWNKTAFVDQSFVGAPNADGTWTRRRFFRKSVWMDKSSFFKVEQLDSAGKTLGTPTFIGTGDEYNRSDGDNFFARRMRAIQWAYDCASPSDCSNAHSFGEEALVELRYANGPNPNFRINAKTTQLRVTWSLLDEGHPYTIPVTQVDAPAWDYGLSIDLNVLTTPSADGSYPAGQPLQVQFTLKDASGKRLHDPGVMPSYMDFLTGNIPSGIQYYRVLSEPFATYYRRKHREKQMMLNIMGPAQNVQPIYSIADIGRDMDWSTGIVTVATPSRDGVYSAATGIPSFAALFAGPPGWSQPSTDTWTFNLPSDLAPGTYYVTMKGRRAYLGEDVPAAKVLPIQVGSPLPTTTPMTTGKCNSCHTKGGEFKRVLHGLDNRAACSGCHMPLNFELEGPISVRTHFIHSRTDRLNASPSQCNLCHTSLAGIQRTSKSACLSCHKSYPADHVQNYGPITDMYVGGGGESFQQCSSSCHTNHPQSGL